MAKNDDIIDFMLNEILNFFGKILGVLETWAGKLIVLLFKGLWSLLKLLWSTLVNLFSKQNTKNMTTSGPKKMSN